MCLSALSLQEKYKAYKIWQAKNIVHLEHYDIQNDYYVLKIKIKRVLKTLCKSQRLWDACSELLQWKMKMSRDILRTT